MILHCDIMISLTLKAELSNVTDVGFVDKPGDVYIFTFKVQCVVFILFYFIFFFFTNCHS